MLLQSLQKYNLKIIHVPGRNTPVADTLSRKFLPAEPEDNNSVEDLISVMHTVLKNIPVSDVKMEQLRKATHDDLHLQQLKIYIQNGWPESRQECHPSVINLWNHRDEMSMIDGVIFKGEKIFLPTALRPSMLEKVHSSYLGVEKTKRRARDILFWPGMTTEIHDTVVSCPICVTKCPSNPKEPSLSHNIPSRPYLITVDYCSRFFDLDLLTTMTSSAIIRKLSAHFATGSRKP